MSHQPFSPFRLHVFCCTNLRPAGHSVGSCGERGSNELFQYLKARSRELGLKNDVKINATGCMSFCRTGPTMVIYPDGVWYKYQSEDDVEEILQSHIIGGTIVERLAIQKR
jgi:(2Fe-2S) ferredoxin